MRRAVEGYRRGVLGVAELAAWYDQDISELLHELGPPDLEEPAGDHLPDGPALAETLDEDMPLFPPGFAPRSARA